MHVGDVRAFLQDLDARWTLPTAEPIVLSIIGSTALMLRTDYRRLTKDSDVIRTASIVSSVEQALVQLAGKNTELHARHGLYLDIVPAGLALLAQQPNWHPLGDAVLRHFSVRVLDVVDVVVSKLKRFNANDRSDIDAMVSAGHAPHDAVLERFHLAMDAHFHDERRAAWIRNFNSVERDSYVR